MGTLGSVIALTPQPLARTVEPPVDAVAPPIEPLFDPIPLAVESFLDALPRTLDVVFGMGGSHPHTEQHA